MQEQLICRVKNPPISNFGCTHEGKKERMTESAGKSVSKITDSVALTFGPCKTMGVAKFLSNFMGLTVSFF